MSPSELLEEVIRMTERLAAELYVDHNIYTGRITLILKDLYWLHKDLTEYE